MSKSNLKNRKRKNIIMHGFVIFLTLLALIPLFSIIGYILVKGFNAIDWSFLTNLPKPVGEPGGGIANAILGTLTLVGIAALIGLPVGVFAAIYINEYAPKSRFATVFRFIIDILLGIPSVVIGIFAYLAFVKPFKHFSAISGSLALAIIFIPIVVRSTENILALVQDDLRDGSYALGASKWQTIRKIVLPTALKGIVTGIMLAIARIAGETAPLLFTAFGNSFWAKSLNTPIASLPAQIFEYARSPYDDWIQKAWGAAFILIVMVLLTNIAARIATRKNA